MHSELDHLTLTVALRSSEQLSRQLFPACPTPVIRCSMKRDSALPDHSYKFRLISQAGLSVNKAICTQSPAWESLPIISATFRFFHLGLALLTMGYKRSKVVRDPRSRLNRPGPITNVSKIWCGSRPKHVHPFPVICDVWYIIEYSPWLPISLRGSIIFSCSLRQRPEILPLSQRMELLPSQRLIVGSTGPGLILPFLTRTILRFLESTTELVWTSHRNGHNTEIHWVGLLHHYHEKCLLYSDKWGSLWPSPFFSASSEGMYSAYPTRRILIKCRQVMSLQSVPVLVTLASTMWLKVELSRLKLVKELVGKYNFQILQQY